MPDPLDALRQPLVPLSPRPEFAEALRRRLEAALGPRDPGGPMASTRHHIPERLHAVTPYLCARDAARAIEFYKEVFGATEESAPIVMPDGHVGHAELRLGDTVIMVADEYPPENVLSPLTIGGTSVQLMLYVEDADAVIERSVEAGAELLRPVTVEYGARTGKVRDPFGHNWFVATHIEPMTGEPEAGDEPAPRHGQLFYFTLGAPDPERCQAFFANLLGWRFVSPRPGGYHITNVSPPGGVHASGDGPAVNVYFTVDDMEAAVARVRELGGHAEDPVLYDSGWNAACRDDQGVEFYLSEPAPGY